MSVNPTQVGRFEASSAELNRLLGAQTGSAQVKSGLEALTSMLIDRIRPAPGRSVTLGPRDVRELEQSARALGPDVEDAFKKLLKDVLGGSIDVGGRRAPVLLLEEAAREQLATFAGKSSISDRTVRGGLAAKADEEGERVRTDRTENMLGVERLRMEGLKGLSRGGKEPKSSEVGLVGAGIRAIARDAGQASVATETLEALAPRIDDAVLEIGTALWTDDKVKAALGKLVADPKHAKAILPSLCAGTGHALSTVLGCKLVDEEVVKKGLQLLPSVGKKLGIEGIEQAAGNIGKVLLKEGAEEAVKTGTKQGVKKGVMGLLSSIPLANVIPMLFTGAEMLAELTKKPPDKRVVGKGLATFALQIGALAFPPLGLAASALDLTGSVAIAVADGQKAGLSKDERTERAEVAIAKRDGRSREMTDAIESNAGLTSQALFAMERSLRELGSGERADLAKSLAARAEDLRSNPADEEQAKSLHHDLGRFSFETLLPEMIDQVKKLRDADPEDRDSWSMMADALGRISASVVGVRSDPERNEPKLKMLISSIVEAAIAGSALAKEASVAKVVGDGTKTS